MRQTGVSAVCPVCFVPGGVRAACKTKSRFTGRGSPRYENYRTKVGKKALAATFLRFWGINNLVSALSAGAAGPIRCRAGFSRRRPEFGIVCYPCPRTFRPGKVRMNLSSLSVYPESLPCSLRQNANKFAFVPGLFVSLQRCANRGRVFRSCCFVKSR